MEVQQNNPEVQNTYISTAQAFLIKAKKNDRGMSKEIKWAIRNNLYSMERLINYITEDNTNGLLQGEDENDDEIIKQLIEIVYGYSIHKIKSLYLTFFIFRTIYNTNPSDRWTGLGPFTTNSCTIPALQTLTAMNSICHVQTSSTT